MKHLSLFFNQFCDQVLLITLPVAGALFPYYVVLLNLLIWMSCKLFLQWDYKSRREADAEIIERIRKTGPAKAIEIGRDGTKVEFFPELPEQEIRKLAG